MKTSYLLSTNASLAMSLCFLNKKVRITKPQKVIIVLLTKMEKVGLQYLWVCHIQIRMMQKEVLMKG